MTESFRWAVMAIALVTAFAACRSRANESSAGQSAATRPATSAAMANMPGVSSGMTLAAKK